MDWLRWPLDNALNWTPHAVVVALLPLGYAALTRHWPLLALSAAVILFGIAWIARSDGLLVRPQDGQRNERALRIVTINVLGTSTKYRALVDFVAETQPDVIVLQEFTGRWAEQTQALLTDYPHQAVETTHGLQVLSRYPLRDIERRVAMRPSGLAREVLSMEIDHEGETLRLIALHGMSARTPDRFRLRSEQYDLVRSLAGDPGHPLIVAGDMNATVLSPALAGLARDLDLRSAVGGRRDEPTWPVWAGPFGIRIDHVLIRGLVPVRVDVGPSIGSDHRPLVVDLRLEAEP